jgi:hypothetical protein
LVTPVPLSPLLLLCCAYGGGSIKISLQAMPYTYTELIFVIFVKTVGTKIGLPAVACNHKGNVNIQIRNQSALPSLPLRKHFGKFSCYSLTKATVVI